MCMNLSQAVIDLQCENPKFSRYLHLYVQRALLSRHCHHLFLYKVEHFDILSQNFTGLRQVKGFFSTTKVVHD